MNSFKPFERTIEQTTETIPPSPKTIAAAMTTNIITSLRELLHYRVVKLRKIDLTLSLKKTHVCDENTLKQIFFEHNWAIYLKSN